ncbi:MAG: hypothetical protein QOJ72_1328 [Nocardioidaceae bacterium]|nr:hypothetical protein [Nocardioidaceae bacterium]
MRRGGSAFAELFHKVLGMGQSSHILDKQNWPLTSTYFGRTARTMVCPPQRQEHEDHYP